ncbi:MAG: hypothetical protein IPJ77_19680 [Planctomycetes bacterium]|nr:hypothetical protein [Planctomycetota bacterium]
MKSTWTFVTLGLFAVGAASAAPAGATSAPIAQEKTAEVRYVRVKDGGAKLLNLADKDADVLLKATAGTVLQVHGESAGFLEVSAPDGLEVWVFGEYAKAASDPGLLEIQASGVRMRPLPSADQKSYALRQSLAKGDKVRFLGRNDPTKPLAEDWLRVKSPATARAWVAATDTTALAAGEDGKTLFEAAQRELATKAELVEVPRGGDSASKPAAKPAAAQPSATEKQAKPASAATPDSLANAEALMEAARKAADPDFSAAKAAYRKILDANPSGASADTARVRLQEIDAREELARQARTRRTPRCSARRRSRRRPRSCARRASTRIPCGAASRRAVGSNRTATASSSAGRTA